MHLMPLTLASSLPAVCQYCWVCTFVVCNYVASNVTKVMHWAIVLTYGGQLAQWRLEVRCRWVDGGN